MPRDSLEQHPRWSACTHNLARPYENESSRLTESHTHLHYEATHFTGRQKVADLLCEFSAQKTSNTGAKMPDFLLKGARKFPWDFLKPKNGKCRKPCTASFAIMGTLQRTHFAWNLWSQLGVLHETSAWRARQRLSRFCKVFYWRLVS